MCRFADVIATGGELRKLIAHPCDLLGAVDKQSRRQTSHQGLYPRLLIPTNEGTLNTKMGDIHAVCFIRDTFIRDIVRILKKERDKPLSFLIL